MTAAPGFTCAGRPSSRATRQFNDTSQRPRCQRTVALRILAVPASRRRASLRVFSSVWIAPIRGNVMWQRSGSILIPPVVNENVLADPVLVLKRGNAIADPRRAPFFDAAQFDNALASARQA